MTKHAQLPDGTILEFPDDTPDAVMDKAVKSHLGGSQNGALASFADAAQHHLMSPLHGAAQLVEHGVNAAANLLPDGNPVRGAVNRTVASDDAALAKREADYQARTPDGAAASLGAVTGDVAPFLLAGPSRILQSAGEKVAGYLPKGAALLRKLASFGTQGGLIGATQPVTDGDYGTQKTLQVGGGAATGMALPAAVSTLRAAGRVAAPIVAPQRVANSQLARLFGSDAGTLDKLTNARQFVPGEQVTAAQAIQTPQAVMVEKALRNRPDMRAQFADVDNANNAARMNVVRGHAGDEAQMTAAVNARREATRPFIAEHLQPGPENTRFARAQKQLADFTGSRQMPMSEFKIVDEARKIAGQVQRGTLDEKEGVQQIQALQPRLKASQKAIEQALTTVNKNMVDPGRIAKTLQQLSLSGNATVRAAAKQHLALLGEHRDAAGKVPAYALDDIRQNIGSMLAQHAPNGVVGSQESALYGPVASKIVSTLDRTIPGYRDYLSAYRAGSVPINTMEASQRILAPADTGGLNSAGDSVLTLARLNSGLNKADKSRYGLSPQARADMQGVRQSLQRGSISNSVNSPGSDTAYNLAADGWLAQQLYGPTMQGPTGKTRGLAMLLGGYLGNHAGVPGGELAGGIGGLYINKAAEAVNSRIAQRVGNGAADSQEAARMIRQFLATQNPEGRARLLQRYPQWAALVADEQAPRRLSH